MTLWFLTTVPLTMVLYVLKEATYQVQKAPHAYGMWGNNPPSLAKPNMVVPTFWNIAFWIWLLGSPSLPFCDCFLRIWCMGGDPARIINQS
jgi:hypothetical protein